MGAPLFLVAQRSSNLSSADFAKHDPIGMHAQPYTNISTVTVSVPTPFGWYFFNLKWGKERRSKFRLAEEGLASKEKISIFYTLILWNFIGLLTLGLTVILYLFKSYLGINLFESKSFLHDFIYPAR